MLGPTEMFKTKILDNHHQRQILDQKVFGAVQNQNMNHLVNKKNKQKTGLTKGK